MEYKNINLELKDLDKGKRLAVIAHAVYNNIDRTKDISRKGMFNDSWRENKEDIALYINHNSDLVPGKPVELWEDNEKAYTTAYFGTHTLGEDTLRMLDEGIIKKASFGYIAEEKGYIEHRGQKVRELKKVKHIETSVLTVLQANPLAGVVSVTKAADIQNALIELKQSIETMEKFCRNTQASDQAIKSVLQELEEAKHIFSRYDVSTQDSDRDASSDESKGFAEALYYSILKTF